MGVGTPGVIKVEGTQYPAPKTWPVEQYDSVAAEALNQNINGIAYTFTEWKVGTTTVSTTKAETFTPTGHTTYTAHFSGKPTQVQNVQFVGAIGEPIHLAWNAHTNSNCQYKIYRIVKDIYNGITGPVLIATLSHGTTEYVDNRYTRSRTYIRYLLRYDVRAYYTVESTYADLYYYAIYGDYPLEKMIAGEQDAGHTPLQIPKRYDLAQSHPNPFNPATTIRYDLPEASRVSLTVYDVMGREVRSWDLQESAGYRQVVWDGKDQRGRLAPTAVYIYRLVAASIESNERFTASRKMVLMK